MNELRYEILQLEKILSQKKKQLFLNRLETISKKPLVTRGVENIDIQSNSHDKTWQISYIHKTNHYSDTMYAYSEDSEATDTYVLGVSNVPNIPDTVDPISCKGIQKETKISFGKSNRYFIRGGIKLHVYRNTSGELRVINPEYEFDLDLDEQKKLVREYSENYDLPEWFAIAVMLYLSDNDWDDAAFINHLSIV